MKRIFSIIRELPSQPIDLEVVKETLLIKCGKVEFKVNKTTEKEFPKIEEIKKTTKVQIDPQLLEEAIDLTAFCVGQEDANYVLGGILFELEKEKMKLVSTDGKRLSLVEKNLPTNQEPIPD